MLLILVKESRSTQKTAPLNHVLFRLLLPCYPRSRCFLLWRKFLFKYPNKPIPLVKAPKGPHAVSTIGNKLSNDEKLVGQFGSWSAYVKGGIKDKSCYIVASNPADKDRSFRIEHQPSWNWFSQVKYHHEDSLDPFEWIDFEQTANKWLFGNNGNRAWLEESGSSLNF